MSEKQPLISPANASAGHESDRTGEYARLSCSYGPPLFSFDGFKIVPPK